MSLEHHVDRIRARVLQDALSEATAAYWRRRAQWFRWAAPRPEDYTGQATPEELDARRQRLLGLAEQCERRAQLEKAGR